MKQCAVSVRDVTRDFRVGGTTVPVLRGVNLEVQQAEIIAIMGPSGSGKSTLLDLIGGLDSPTSGEIQVMGRSLAAMSQAQLAEYRRDQVGFVFQSFDLIPSMTAMQNVGLPLLFGGVKRLVRRLAATEALARVGLSHRLDHLPTEMSGGERQRTAIARALINHPAVLLADEPTGNLDSRSGQEVLELMCELNAEQGQAIILTTHDERVAGFAHRTLHFSDGLINQVPQRGETL